jgi:viroplasmin and RNaseH domain-containing protein
VPAPGDPPRKFYVVRRGRSLGIYYSWTDCSSQVTGFSNAEFKSFKSFAEARNYLTK